MSLMRLDDRTRPWWTLIGTCFGLFLLMLDSTVVDLALTEIKGDLGASAAGLQWIMNGYLLVLASLMVTAGRLGDILGRRRVFIWGMALFAAGSVLAGAAWDDGPLIAARAIQGAGGAAMLSLSLAIVCDAFPRERQPQALGIWSAISAVALAIGPLVGGALVELDWRLIFWINLPLCAVGIAITRVAARESRDTSAGQTVDLPGVAALSAGLGAVVLAMIQSDVWGFGSPQTLGLLAAGLLSLVAFWGIEHRVAEPIVDFSLFRNRPYLGATAAAFALVGAYWSVMFYQPQYLQQVLGETPIAAGLLILPITAPMVMISPLSGRLIRAFGVRALMTAGLVVAAAGLALLTGVGPDSDYLALAPGYALFGISLGLVYAPMSTAAMAAMPAEKAGIAAGVLAMNRVMAGAVGLALVGAVFQSLRSDSIAEGNPEHDAFATAMADSTWILVALVAVGALVTWLLLRPSPEPGAEQRHRPEHRILHRRFHL
jgi:EmrB/QacA subfamily drug resistance transporter